MECKFYSNSDVVRVCPNVSEQVAKPAPAHSQLRRNPRKPRLTIALE